MATATPPDNSQGSSTRPYLLRALHDWCTDNGFTPYIAVQVGAGVQVPMEYVKNNEIVLNIAFEATSGLQLGNETIEFKARFGGVSREIRVPVDHVVAIYARENGQGMAFPMPAGDGARGSSVEGSATPLVPVPAVSAGPAAAGGPKGLRLATSEGESTPGDAAGAGVAALTATEQPPEPPDPQAPPPRPALKRIK
jgi:stringent starvation protein B